MLNLTGQRFDRLLAIKDSGKRKNNHAVWLCRCDCGNLAEILACHLKSRNTQSCGCLRREKAMYINYKHGGTITRIYGIWADMNRRCFNQNNKSYKYYGGRGIKVCSEWKDNFVAFRFWAILSGYKDNLTIDRIDNDGNYEPDNCQWITQSENSKKSIRRKHE